MTQDHDDVKEVSAGEAREMIGQGDVIFLDVRAATDFEQECIHGAIHLTPDNFDEFLNTTDKDKPIICYCYFGNSSLGVCAALQEQGFRRTYSLSGGFAAWKDGAA